VHARGAAELDAPREAAVGAEHAFELGVPGDGRARADEAADRPFAQVARERLGLCDRAGVARRDEIIFRLRGERVMIPASRS
jgi:hypothetical protein